MTGDIMLIGSKQVPRSSVVFHLTMLAFLKAAAKKSAWDTWNACPKATGAVGVLSQSEVPLRQKVKAAMSTIERFTILICNRTIFHISENETRRQLLPKKGDHISPLYCWSTPSVRLVRMSQLGATNMFGFNSYFAPKCNERVERYKVLRRNE